MGTFATETHLRERFGSENISAWSDYDNSGVADPSDVISNAIDLAEADINNKFRNTQYGTPLVVTGGDLLVVREWVVVKAAVRLRAARPANLEEDDSDDYVLQLGKEVDKEIRDYQLGVKEFDDSAYAESQWPTAPMNVCDGSKQDYD